MAGGLGLGNRHRAWFQVEESLRVSTPRGSSVAPPVSGRARISVFQGGVSKRSVASVIRPPEEDTKLTTEEHGQLG